MKVLRLKLYGINGALLRWLNSYLENRNQRVVLKDGISEAGNVRAGVPQGSVLDSRLLIVYINDIADEVLGLCRLFAYDTSICHSAHDEHTLVNLTDIDLSNISKWSEQWFVKLNPDKTDIRDRPFNLKGGLWFFVSEMFYRTTQELEY